MGDSRAHFSSSQNYKKKQGHRDEQIVYPGFQGVQIRCRY